MRLTVLGCGAAYPRPGGACSGFLVRGGGANVWLDAGNGTFSRLQEHLSFRELDAVVLSHRHGDHTADVLPLMYALAFDPVPRSPLPVYAPQEVPAALSAFLGEGSKDLFERAFDFRRIDEVFEVKGLRFEPFQTVHPTPTYGVRVGEGTGGGPSLVYTADTGDFAELPAACRDVGLLLAEATFVGSETAPPGLHLWAREAGAIAKGAGVGRLLVTHVWPTHRPEDAVAEAREVYDGPVDAAVEGQTYDL